MKPVDLVEWVVRDPLAIVFYFMVLILLTFGANGIGPQQGNEPPYKYLYSILVYGVCIPGVLSATVWMYSMFFESRSLWELDFFAYYLPIISMLFVLLVMKKNCILKTLPWFGELYELLILIAVTFAFILLIMHLDILPFKNVWHVLLSFLFIFGLFKIGWDRFLLLTR